MPFSVRLPEDNRQYQCVSGGIRGGSWGIRGWSWRSVCACPLMDQQCEVFFSCSPLRVSRGSLVRALHNKLHQAHGSLRTIPRTEHHTSPPAMRPFASPGPMARLCFCVFPSVQHSARPAHHGLTRGCSKPLRNHAQPNSPIARFKLLVQPEARQSKQPCSRRIQASRRAQLSCTQ